MAKLLDLIVICVLAANLFAGERVNLWPDGKMPGGG